MSARRLVSRLLPALAGPAAFAGAAIAGAKRIPDYRHRDEPMSALAAKGTDSSPVMISGFVALGACTCVLARSLRDSPMPP
jgi:hypothetical protein